MKKIFALITAAVLLLVFCSCGAEGGTATTNQTSVSTSADSTADTSAVTTEIISTDSDYFADGDYKEVSDEAPDAEITLSGDSGTISDTTRGSSGATVTITSKGVYRVTGSSEDVTIVVADEAESGNVYIVLDGATMKNTFSPCILVEKADKVIIQTVSDSSLTYTATSSEYDGAVYSADDIVFNGGATLSVVSSLHGVVGKDDVKITGSTLEITSDSIGIKANDSLRIGGGDVIISSGHDGVQIENDDGTSYFYMESGTLTVDAGYDGVDAVGLITFAGGTASITAGGGSASSKDSGKSQKGVKCDGDIVVTDGADVTISSADDAIHSSNNVTVTGGTVAASSSDDGIHADNVLTISGGSVTVSKSYEGLEAYEVNIAGGDISVTASDDGINAAGGSDTSSSDSRPGFWGGTSSTGTLTISGGTLYVNAKGDGLDSNGSLYVSGGVTIVEGSTDNGNGALDVGDGADCVASITGGTVLAIGSTGMAVNFGDGTHCSALVSLSGSAGDTISVDDGSGFTFTATKSFSCVVYSSPSMTSGSTYTITSGSSSATADFSSSLYYSTVTGMGGMGGPGMR